MLIDVKAAMISESPGDKAWLGMLHCIIVALQHPIIKLMLYGNWVFYACVQGCLARSIIPCDLCCSILTQAER